MNQEKLVETRGQEPEFMAPPAGETWQRVDLGLGAAAVPTRKASQENPKRGKAPVYWMIGVLAALVLIGAVMARSLP